MDVAGLSYKAGDKYLASARGKSNQPVCFLDTTGRSYSLLAHTLPSARGQGEPLSGRVSPPSGAGFVAAIMGQEKDAYLMSTDAGYGFVVRYADLLANKKAGKSVLNVPKGAKVQPPRPVKDPQTDLIALVSNEGRLLVFPVRDLPEMSRGKGNKMMAIPGGRVAERVEFVQDVQVLGPDDTLVIYAGKRHLNLKASDLEHYFGERGRRGAKLPRGFQNVDVMTVEAR